MTFEISDFDTNYKDKDRRKNFISKVKTDGKKRKVWLHQFVHFFGNEAWIPISIGRIAAQCRTNKEDKFLSQFCFWFWMFFICRMGFSL